MTHGWYISRDGGEDGPLQPSELRRMVKAGELREQDRVRRQDRTAPIEAVKVRGLFPTSDNPPETGPPSREAAHAPAVALDAVPARAVHDSDADLAEATAELYRTDFESRLTSESSLLANASLSPRRREGIAGYASLLPGERVLAAHDSTLFGVGTEGFVLTDRAIAWNYPDGNRGRVLFASIKSTSVFTDSRAGAPLALCFRSPVSCRIPAKSVPATTLDDLAEFLARAVRVHQGLDADRVLPTAKSYSKAGNALAAIALWQLLLEDDALLFPRVRSEVSEAKATSPQDQQLTAFHASIESLATDRTANWLVPKHGQGVDSLALEGLRERWRSGELLPDSPLRHLSDILWNPAWKTPAAEGQRVVFVTDTGDFDEAQFRACLGSLSSQGLGYESLLVFGPTSGRVETVAGKPILHVGLTAEELVLAWMVPEGHVTVERSPLFTVVWKLDDPASGRQIEVATARRTAKIILRPSAGTDQFVRIASEVFLAGSEQAILENRRTDASRLLGRVIATETLRDRVSKVRPLSCAEEEVLVVYEGGHPESVEPCVGTLRLDGDGIEFRSIAPETSTFFRIPFEKVVDFASPQRGAMPADLRKSLFGPDSLISAGLGVAAACVIPGGAMLVRSLSGTLMSEKQAGPPINRLVVVVMLSGVAYKLHFDVVGQTVAEMTQKAKVFWSRTARAKPRFHRGSAAAPGGSVSPGSDAETKSLLRDIRESLHTLLKLVALDVAERNPAVSDALRVEVRQSLRHSLEGLLTQQRGSGDDGVSSAPKAVTLVIACPACNAKIRAVRPGVLRCSVCSAAMRVGEELFREFTPEARVPVEKQQAVPEKRIL